MIKLDHSIYLEITANRRKNVSLQLAFTILCQFFGSFLVTKDLLCRFVICVKLNLKITSLKCKVLTRLCSICERLSHNRL